MNYSAVIPARYASTRLPGKPLLKIQGKPMVQWVYQRALQSGASRCVVATDDQRIADVVAEFGGEVCMTSSEHNSGTERIAEVIDTLKIPDDEIVVNVQGDEPLIPAATIHQVAENLANANCPMATLAVPLTDPEELFNPNVVKVLADQNGYALYFSRSVIPYDRQQFATTDTSDLKLTFPYLRHIGIYAYRAGFVGRYINWQATELEKIESLEQLRVLWHGERIHVAEAVEIPPPGIDTPEDLERLNSLLSGT